MNDFSRCKSYNEEERVAKSSWIGMGHSFCFTMGKGKSVFEYQWGKNSTKANVFKKR